MHCPIWWALLQAMLEPSSFIWQLVVEYTYEMEIEFEVQQVERLMGLEVRQDGVYLALRFETWQRI